MKITTFLRAYPSDSIVGDFSRGIEIMTKTAKLRVGIFNRFNIKKAIVFRGSENPEVIGFQLDFLWLSFAAMKHSKVL